MYDIYKDNFVTCAALFLTTFTADLKLHGDYFISIVPEQISNKLSSGGSRMYIETFPAGSHTLFGD